MSGFPVLSLVLSTIAFFVAGYFAKRYLDESGIPPGATRSVSIFVIAAAVSYGVAAVVDWMAG